MDQDNTPEAEVDETEEVTPEPYESEGARRLRVRAEAKAEAAVTMKKEADKALKAKNKRLGAAPQIEGLKEFREAAAEVEARINADEEAR